MDSDMDGTFMLLRLLGPATSVLSIFALGVLFSPMLLYVLARWRAQREPQPDPQLGLKFAAHYFALLASQLAMAGLATAIYCVISGTPTNVRGEGLRDACGLLLPAGALLAGALVFLRFTNDRVAPSVRRLFVGYNLLATGLVAFAAVVAGCEVLFAKHGGDGLGYVAASGAVVYGGAAVGLGWLLSTLALRAPAGAVMPAPAPAPVASAPALLHRD